MRDMPHFMVEIVHTIKMDSYWLCGAAPMKKLMVLLALPKVIEGRLVNIGKYFVLHSNNFLHYRFFDKTLNKALFQDY